MQTYVFWRGSGAVRCHYETLAASVQEYNASRVRTLHLKALYYYMGDSYSDLFGCLLATFRRFSNLRELYIEAGEKLCDSDMAALLPEVPNLQHLFLKHEPDGWLEDHDHWDLSSTICQSLLHLPDLTNLYLGGIAASKSDTLVPASSYSAGHRRMQFRHTYCRLAVSGYQVRVCYLAHKCSFAQWLKLLSRCNLDCTTFHF